MTTTQETSMTLPESVQRSIARATLPELQSQLGMTEDALTIPDNPNAPKLAMLAAAYQARINQLRGIGDTRTASADEDVTIGRRAGSAAANQFGTFSVHAASDKQVGFLRKLIDTKDLTGVTIPTSLDGISKKAASALIDKLIDRQPPAAPVGAPAQTARPASEKQIAFMTRLAAERNWAGVIQGVDIDTESTDWAKVPGAIASKVIDALLAAPRKQVTKAADVKIAAGAYRVEGRMIRVYFGRQSGQMLASELVDITATNRDDAWHYLGLATRFVSTDAHRLTAEEAETLNDNDADHGWCCVCGAYLDDPNSVRRGIGPVCRAKQGG